MKKSSLVLILALLGLAVLSAHSQNPIRINSPDGKIDVRVLVGKDNRLVYSISFLDQPVLLQSPLGITINRIDLGEGVSLKSIQPNAGDEFNEILLPILHEASLTEYFLSLRVYNDGCAYRYLVPGKQKRRIYGESSAWRFPPGCQIWWQSDIKVYEGVYKESELSFMTSGTKIGPPATIKLPNNSGYALVSEANLVEYSGMSLVLTGANILRVQFPWDRKGWTYTGNLKTPWRITILSADLDGMVNSALCANLCPAPEEELLELDWIRPGKAIWHWWSVGGPNLKQQQEWIDRTSTLGFDYYLIDDGWKNWKEGQKNNWECLREIIEHAQSKNVKILVWVQYEELRTAKKRREYLRRIKETGAAGVKIDFIPGESKKIVDWYEDTLGDLAEFQLLANFHGCNKPTGRQRTWPHELTREGIRGHEYHMKRLGRSLPPSHNTIIPFTRYVVGPADYTPTALNPEELRGYTWAYELAQAIVLSSPLTHFADNPVFYIGHPAEEFLKILPTVWDETRVLPQSVIGKTAAFARRSGQTWFIGILNGSEPQKMTINLDFLDRGVYQSLEFYDNPKNDAAVTKIERTRVAKESIDLSLKKAGGFVAILKRIDMNH